MRILLILLAVLSLALPTIAQGPLTVGTTVVSTLAEVTGEQTSLYNAICIYNDITPGDIGMKYFRVLAREYAVQIGLVYELYTFNGYQNIEILHAKPSTKNEISEKTLDSPLHHNTGATINDNDTAQQHAHHVNHIVSVVHDTLVVYKSILTEKAIKITAIDTVTVVVIVPVNTRVPFCDCSNKSERELNKYYTDILAQRRACKDAELKDRLGFCAYQIRKYKKSAYKRHSHKEESMFKATLPDMHIGEYTNTSAHSSAPPKKRKKRVRKLGNGHAKGRGGFLSKLFPFANC